MKPMNPSVLLPVFDHPFWEGIKIVPKGQPIIAQPFKARLGLML